MLGATTGVRAGTLALSASLPPTLTLLTVTVVVADVFPASSVAVTETVSPAFKPFTGILNLPSLSAFADTLVPSGRVTSTVDPASAVPVTAVSPALTGFTTGAVGAVISA